MGLGLVLFVLLIVLAFYVFFCFCAKRICEKCGVNPGILIWIPIANLVPLLHRRIDGPNLLKLAHYLLQGLGVGLAAGRLGGRCSGRLCLAC